MPAQAVVENSLLTTRRPWLVLALACGAWFLDVVDMNITNIAMPSIRHELHFSFQNLQWLRSAYALTYGSFLLLGGRGADLIGRLNCVRRRDGALWILVADWRTRRQPGHARRCPAGTGSE